MMALAAHFEPFHSGVRCTDCGASHPHAEGIVRHSSRCGIMPKQSERFDLAAVAVEVTAVKTDVAKAAREGRAYSVTDEDGLRDEVRAKRLSVSDAMNQDD